MFDAKYVRGYITKDVTERIDEFWQWFSYYQYQVLEAMNKTPKDTSVVYVIDEELRSIFNEYKKPLCFEFGMEDGKCHFYFHFGRSSYLLTVASELFDTMPRELKTNWAFHLEK